MINNDSHVKKINDKFYYGWVIVAISALTALFSAPGQTYFISGFINYFIEEFEISRTVVSQYYSISTLGAGLLLPFVGRFIDNHGAKLMTLVIASLLILITTYTGFIATPIMLIFSFFSLRLLGQGSMSLLSNVVVPKWFNKKRALALSIVSVGSVIGSTFIPPVNTFINNTIGWRITWFIWAGALLIIFIPIVLIFLKNRPKEVGLAVDNQRLSKEEKIAEKQKGIENDWELSEALKTRTFWFMAISTAIPAFINTGLFFHLYSIIESNGLNESTAAIILSLYGALSFLFSFVAGYILDRIKVRYVLVVSFIMQFLNIILLINATTVMLAILFGVNLGIIAGIQRVSRKVIWPNYYGKKALGSISGFTMTTLVIGTSISPLIIGASYDYFKGYTEVLMFIAGFTIVGAFLAFVSPKPKGRLSNK